MGVTHRVTMVVKKIIESTMTNTSGRIFALFIFIITITYGVFQARTLIHGPSLLVSSPKSGETITTVLMNISGTTENVTHVTLNGQPITMDTSGAFTSKLITPKGYGVMLIEASNRFGRHQEERIEFLGNPVEEQGPDTLPLETEVGELSRNY